MCAESVVSNGAVDVHGRGQMDERLRCAISAFDRPRVARWAVYYWVFIGLLATIVVAWIIIDARITRLETARHRDAVAIESIQREILANIVSHGGGGPNESNNPAYKSPSQK